MDTQPAPRGSVAAMFPIMAVVFIGFLVIGLAKVSDEQYNGRREE